MALIFLCSPHLLSSLSPYFILPERFSQLYLLTLLLIYFYSLIFNFKSLHCVHIKSFLKIDAYSYCIFNNIFLFLWRGQFFFLEMFSSVPCIGFLSSKIHLLFVFVVSFILEAFPKVSGDMGLFAQRDTKNLGKWTFWKHGQNTLTSGFYGRSVQGQKQLWTLFHQADHFPQW